MTEPDNDAHTGHPAGGDSPVNLYALTPPERNQFRLLALRYRVRRDTTLRPLADVLFDLRSRHGLQLNMGQVSSCWSSRTWRGVELDHP